MAQTSWPKRLGESNVGLSESAWTIVTNLPTGKMTAFGAKLEGLLNKQMKLTTAYLFARMAALINSRAQRSLCRERWGNAGWVTHESV